LPAALSGHIVKLAGDDLLTRCMEEHESKRKLADKVYVYINNEPASLKDVKPNMSARILTNDKGEVAVLDITAAIKVKPPKPER
jgi:hypothetical protein